MANNSATSKSRYFAIVSYIPDTGNIIQIIQSKSKSIRSYAVIKHDKDGGELHHHIVIRTHSTWTPTQITKWFSGHKDENGKDINNFVQTVIDRTAIIQYLTHENETDKYHYEQSEIIDCGISDILPSGESNDDAFEIIEMLERGTSIREMCRLYGREFIYHYANYMLVIEKIRDEECKQ